MLLFKILCPPFTAVRHIWVLQIFDKLCQSFGGDVLQILRNSAGHIEDCPPERLFKQWAQFCLDQSIAIVTFHILSRSYFCLRAENNREPFMICFLSSGLPKLSRVLQGLSLIFGATGLQVSEQD